MTTSILPSAKVSDNVLDTYNSVLAFHYLVECSMITNLIENDRLERVCLQNFKVVSPTIADYNHIVNEAIATQTAAFRYPSQLCNNIRKIATTLVPFPRLHFFALGIGNCYPRYTQDYK